MRVWQVGEKIERLIKEKKKKKKKKKKQRR